MGKINKDNFLMFYDFNMENLLILKKRVDYCNFLYNTILILANNKIQHASPAMKISMCLIVCRAYKNLENVRKAYRIAEQLFKK